MIIYKQSNTEAEISDFSSIQEYNLFRSILSIDGTPYMQCEEDIVDRIKNYINSLMYGDDFYTQTVRQKLQNVKYIYGFDDYLSIDKNNKDEIYINNDIIPDIDFIVTNLIGKYVSL